MARVKRVCSSARNEIKAVCEVSQTAFCNDYVTNIIFVVLTLLSFLDIL